MYTVICDAKYGRHKGIYILGLVDRKKSGRSWWTPYNKDILKKFRSEKSAEDQCSKLRRNNPRAVKFKTACRFLDDQRESLIRDQAEDVQESG